MGDVYKHEPEEAKMPDEFGPAPPTDFSEYDRTDKIAAALAKAQSEIANPVRNREVTVVSKRTGGKYKFKYATLDQIYDTIRNPLTKNGLWVVQPLLSRS